MNVAQVRHIQLTNKIRKGVKDLNKDNHPVDVICRYNSNGEINYSMFLWDGSNCVGHTMMVYNKKPLTAKQLLPEFRKNLKQDLANKEAQRLDVEQTED